MTTAGPVTVSFDAYTALLQRLLAQRKPVVDALERLLNSQKRPLAWQQDQLGLALAFREYLQEGAGLTASQTALFDQLEQAHWAGGFKPRATTGNDIIDPAALLLRGFHCWRQTRWPGQRGRLRYAHTLFNVAVLRCLTLLVLRIWDQDADGAGARLQQLQAILAALWQGSPADQPVLVRDVRWLFPVAMSPTTDVLDGYFDVAARIAATLPAADQLEIQTAAVQTGAGHLRAQLRHLSVQRQVSLNDHDLVLTTRVSNALDISLLMEGLATLLQAYDAAVQRGDDKARLPLAAAICEGLSPDPQLFVNRLDLLGPYTMIEHQFITTTADGVASYTARGERHMQLLQRYKTLLAALASPLSDDCQRCRPAADGYAPYGALYGFSSNLLELMAFKTLQLDADIRFCLEDIFTSGGADKRAWVSGWRNLPHVPPEVVRHYEYPAAFASAMHARVEQALQQHIADSAAGIVAPCGKLVAGAAAAGTEALPVHYVVASDADVVAAGSATPKDEADLLYCRLEGEFLVSWRTEHGWAALTKDLLTDVLGEGQSASVASLPPAAVTVLQLMCPDMVQTQAG